MKAGKSLEELLKEVKRRDKVKKDYMAVAKGLRMILAPDLQPKLVLGAGKNKMTFGINHVAHDQIAGYLGIPRQYYDKMVAKDPELLAKNVNAWFEKTPEDERRMVRTLDDIVRALPSDRYGIMDNFDLCEAVLPPLMERKVSVLSCDVTDERMYIKVVDSKIKRDLKVNELVKGKEHGSFDTVSPAVCISNSEVGRGGIGVQGSVFTGGCRNLMVLREKSVRKYHVGGRFDMGAETVAMLSDKTKKLTDDAFWSQIRDVVAGAFDQAKFDATCAKLEATAVNKLDDKADVTKVVELTAKKFSLTDNERGSVLNHFIKSGNLTQYGLHSAITRAAEDNTSYDRASEMEQVGADIIELGKKEWAEIARAA